MSLTVLVTGATGTIGTELIKALTQTKLNVIAGSSSGKQVAGVETRRVDFNDVNGMVAAFKGIDTLFLLLPFEEKMVEYARNAVDAAKQAGVRHILRTSGNGSDSSSATAISKVHGIVDDYIAQSGVPFTIGAPTIFMQNYINFYGGMIRGGALYLPNGEGKMSLIDVRDVAAAYALILQNPAAHAGKTYTLTGAEAVSDTDIAAIIGKKINKTINYVAVPDAAAAASMKEMGMPQWNVDTLLTLSQAVTAGYLENSTPDLEALLNRTPISFDQFATDYASAWQ